MFDALGPYATIWGGWKIAIGEWLDVSHDALHIHLGLFLLCAFAFLTRKRLDQWTPWLCLLAFELFNEFIDLNQLTGDMYSNWPATQHDILNTMFAPTLIVFYLKWRRRVEFGDDSSPESNHLIKSPDRSTDDASVTSQDAAGHSDEPARPMGPASPTFARDGDDKQPLALRSHAA